MFKYSFLRRSQPTPAQYERGLTIKFSLCQILCHECLITFPYASIRVILAPVFFCPYKDNVAPFPSVSPTIMIIANGQLGPLSRATCCLILFSLLAAISVV